jgi:hypothetical protein
MTTIAYRDGVLAADSCFTHESEAGGSRRANCIKLYRKFVTLHNVPEKRVEIQDVLVGLSGESGPGMVFLDAIFAPRALHDEDATRELFAHGGADFSALVLTRNGLFEYDGWYRGERVIEPYWAIGSGTKVALGAMEMSATAEQAVTIACRWDAHTRGPVVTAELLPYDTDYDKMSEDVAKGLIEITSKTA